MCSQGDRLSFRANCNALRSTADQPVKLGWLSPFSFVSLVPKRVESAMAYTSA